ncbi:MAG: hypothetical protein SGBAC_000282 [Bacillariaceae sp.]
MNWLLVIVLLNVTTLVKSFTSPQTINARGASTQLMAGFGAATASKQKTSKNKKGSKQAPFDVNASVSRLEKKYDVMMLASAKRIAKQDEDPRFMSQKDEKDQDTITSEYMIAARSSSKKGINDWVPIAQFCVAYPESSYHDEDNSQDVLQTAVSSYCREISHVAGMGAPLFSSVARNDMQYSAEPVDSFFKHVYEQVVEDSGEKKGLSKSEARNILGLGGEDGSDKSQIKKAYRNLSFKLHPDRLDDNADAEAAAARFESVQAAYEALNSGLRESGKSWYESLGGRARTDFSRINLQSLSDSTTQMEKKQIKGGMMGLDPDLVQLFVARHLRSE